MKEESKLKSWPMHPFLIIIFTLLFIYYSNILELSFYRILFPLVIALSVISVVFFVTLKFLTDKYKAGIIATTFALLFFNYGRAYDLINSPPQVEPIIWKTVMVLLPLSVLLLIFVSKRKYFLKMMEKKVSFSITTVFILATLFLFAKNIKTYLSVFHPLHIAHFLQSNEIVLLLLFILAFLVTAAIVWKQKNKKKFSSLNYYLNVFSIVLVILLTIQIAFHHLNTGMENMEINSNFAVEFNPVNIDKENSPDAYYIILDGYAGEKALKEHAGFDNSNFVGRLESRNFHVASESRTNYLYTYLSLSSSLNMNYVNFYSDLLGKNSKNRDIPYQDVDYNNAALIFKKLGYKFVQISSGWGGSTEENDFADVFYEQQNDLDEMTYLFLYSTPVRFFLDNDVATNNLYIFDILTKIPELPGPKFVFAHIYAPHPPYVFDAEGNVISNEIYKEEQWENVNGYIEQMKFVNKKTLEAVDSIIENSDNLPIIIIQGDHGFFSSAEAAQKPTRSLLEERSYILNAYFLPDKNSEDVLYEGISPVNSFRVIFNNYFNQGLELLDDRTYYSNLRETPYNFTLIFDKDGNYVGPFPDLETTSTPIQKNADVVDVFNNENVFGLK